MELSVDTILMTLLVGVVTSLCGISFFCLFFASFLRVPLLARLFRFLFWEDRPYREGGDAHGETPAGHSEHVYFTLLLIAATFGLGVAMDIASDKFNDKGLPSSIRSAMGIASDSDIRVKTFMKVAAGEIVSGRPNDDLRRLFTDYLACKPTFDTASEQKPAITHGSDAGFTINHDPCLIIGQRVTEFYYHAKNKVFSEENYFDELKEIQSRIDFTRSMAFALLILAAIYAFALLTAMMAELIEYLVSRHPRLLTPGSVRWWRSRRRNGAGLTSHIKNLSELRLTMVMIGAAGAGWASLSAWEGLEKGYDGRVFGYYLCESCQKQDKEGDKRESAASQFRVPDSVFRVFSSESGHFEPSAVASLGLIQGSNLFLVANDKDGDNLYLFELKAGKLTFLRNVPLSRGGENGTLKIEALATIDDGKTNLLPSRIFLAARRKTTEDNENAGENSLVYTATLRDSPALRDAVAKSRPGSEARLVLSPVPGSNGTCAAVATARKRVGSPAFPLCDIEGLAYFPSADATGPAAAHAAPRLAIAVRSVGRPNTTEWRPLLALLTLDLDAQAAVRPAPHAGPLPLFIGTFPAGHLPACHFSTPESGAPKAAVRNDPPGAFAISDLAFATSDTGSPSLLILSSYEAASACRDKEVTERHIEDVQGAIWRAPMAALASPAAFAGWLRSAQPLTRLAHKPEGIALLTQDSDTAVIVFDDDAVRKNTDRAPDTFALEQDESVFLTLKLPQE